MKPRNHEERKKAFWKFLGVLIAVLALWTVALFSMGFVNTEISDGQTVNKGERAEFEDFMTDINSKLEELDNSKGNDNFPMLLSNINIQLNNKRNQIKNNQFYSNIITIYDSILVDKAKINRLTVGAGELFAGQKKLLQQEVEDLKEKKDCDCDSEILKSKQQISNKLIPLAAELSSVVSFTKLESLIDEVTKQQKKKRENIKRELESIEDKIDRLQRDIRNAAN